MYNAVILFYSILNSHMYHINYNKLLTATEYFLTGHVSGVLAAFWTNLPAEEVRFDMNRNNVVKCEELLSSDIIQSLTKKRQNNVAAVDVTPEVQSTIQHYVNLFGGRIIDFDAKTSPFADLNTLLLGSGREDVGNQLLRNTKAAITGTNRFRMCLICELQDGERTMLELNYNSDGKLEMPTEEEEGSGTIDDLFRAYFLKS